MFDQLSLWQDDTPRDGAMNMALDEAMLELGGGPWLRVYGWIEPTVSIGFAQNLDIVPAAHRGLPVVRRWTGGGVVVHDDDWTYTLAVPGRHHLADQRAAETYRRIHEAMMAAFARSGIADCTLQAEAVSNGMGLCFVEPARFDLLCRGRKIAGAAQRRTRLGFLHQGSVQPLKPPRDFGKLLAEELACQVSMVNMALAESLLLARARELSSGKYGQASWLRDREHSMQGMEDKSPAGSRN